MIKLISQLKQTRAELEGEYQELLRTFKPDYPDMKQLRSRIDVIDNRIDLEQRSIRSSLKTDREKIQATIYVNEEISAKALFFVEEYFLSHSMQLADALIGATASMYGMTLITANDKHYKIIKKLEMKVFRP